jgi:hypothetical protein
MAANARLRLLLCLAVAVQSAAAIDLLLRERLRSMYAGIAIVVAAIVYLLTTSDFPTDAARDVATLSLVPSALVLIVAAICVALRRRAAVVVLALAVVAELWIADARWNPVVPDAMMYPKTPLLATFDRVPRHEPFRIVGNGPVYFPNVSALYGLEDIRAHDPMANGRYLGALRVLGDYDTDDYFAKWTNFETGLLDYLNVKYVITQPGGDLADRERYAMLYDGKDGRVYENRHVLPRFHPVDNVILEFKGDTFMKRLTAQTDWAHTAVVKQLPVSSDQERVDLLAPRPPSSPRATLSLTHWTPTDFHMRVHAPRATLIVSSQPWWPGWRATRDGRPLRVLQVNGPFLGFVVPPGDAEIRVYYMPLSFYVGLAVSLLTILAMTIAPKMRRRSRGAMDASSPGPNSSSPRLKLDHSDSREPGA